MAQFTHLYTTQQIKMLEQIASQEFHITPEVLMERAGSSALSILMQRWPNAQKIAVFCGSGNNGGDGFVLAKLAHLSGLQVNVFYVGHAEQKPTALIAARACESAGVSIRRFESQQSFEADVVVDALLGTGVRGALQEPIPTAISAINSAGCPILSLDVPSGLDPNTGFVNDSAVSTTLTVTFIGVKQGLLTGHGPIYSGEVMVTDLQLPASLYDRVKASCERLDLKKMQELLIPRPKTAHKGQFGHILIIGGDRGMPGSVHMVGEAALRVGAGLVTVATRPEHIAAVTAMRPELMCQGIQQGEQLIPLLEKATVVVLGPGLGQSSWSGELFEQTMTTTHLPMVVDADGLNLLAQRNLSRNNWILTPHPGEAARLLSESGPGAVQADRFTAIKLLQKRWGGNIVLKGAGTLVYGISEQLKLCDAGNPGMATAGMGDVLSGVIAGLVAQGLPLESAAQLGVSLHAASADLFAQQGQRGMLALDLMPFLQRLVNP